jgi:hypothetical protein
MSKIVDNLIAFRILYMLVTPFEETEACKLGVIDKKGKKLKEPKTEAELESYDYLHRLVFNLKRILAKLPGGDSRMKNIVAAMFLIKEQYNNKIDTITEEDLLTLINSDVILAEETIQYKMFMEDGEGGGGIAGQGQVTPSTEPVNKTGPETSTDQPVIRKKKPPIVRRSEVKLVTVQPQKGY